MPVADVVDATSQPTILLVDDDAQIRRALRHALIGIDGAVLEAENGSAAVDLAASARGTASLTACGAVG